MPKRVAALLPIFAALLCAPGAAALGWSGVPLPRHTGLSGVSCRSTSWCEAVGGWGNRLQVAHWNGKRWSVSTNLPDPRGASLFGISCRSRRSCVAVGQLFPYEHRPVEALIERWDGRRWHLVNGPTADSPLHSISCTSTRACTAVGGFEHQVGTPDANNQQVEYPSVVERWNGTSWSLGSLTGATGSEAGGLLGVSCTSASICMGVGNEVDTATYEDQALAASGNGVDFAGTPLAFPSSVYRGGSQPPQTVLSAVDCQTSASCAAVGRYAASNGAIGPLAAFWNGTGWSQVALRRGPVELDSVSCPALGWCMAVGQTIAEALR